MNRIMLVSLLAVVALSTGCNYPTPTPGPKSSALYLNSTIAPAPIVGVPVVWHIEAGVDPVYGRTFPSNMFVNIPPEVEIVAGERTWEGDLPFDGTHSMDLVIRVLAAGVFEISAQVSTGDEGSSFGASQAFIIESTTTSAKVTDVLDVPEPTLNAIWFGTATPLP